ncbi:MAG: hypothetical protein GEV08_12130 [Acidimicrobiia bacterium]|nr:hypothetical protein [Acidimicrobiia bacterium]
MTTPFSWEEWEDKVRQLLRGAPVERYAVRLRHWRKAGPRARDGSRPDVQRVAVYHSEAEARDRPRAIFEVPADAELGSLEDGALVVVEGWPEPGGAIAFEAAGRRVLTRTPGELPFFGAPRFGSG